MNALLLAVFIDLVGFGIVIPLLPFYTQRFGASADTVTLIVAAYTAAQFVTGPLWGRLSDRIGRRPVILITIAGTALGYVWLAYSDSILMVIAARAFGGGMAANVAVIQAYTADVTAPERRAKALGRMSAAFGSGFVTGPAIGGLLAGDNATLEAFQLPFFVAAGFSALSLVGAALYVRESLPEHMRAGRGRDQRGRLRLLIDSLERPQVGRIIALMFLTPFVFSAFESIFALWSARALGWGPTLNGYIYTWMGVVAVASQAFAIGPLVRRFGERGLVLTGTFAAATGFMLAPLTLAMPTLYAGTGLVVFGVCANYTSLSTLLSNAARPDERGTLLGVGQFSSGLARIVGPLWAGFAFVHLGRDWPFMTGAFAMLLMAALSLTLLPPPVKKTASKP
jgi:DHA1 family tetracycline resistance protein-like MFS transporter